MTDYLQAILTGRAPGWIVLILLGLVIFGQNGADRVLNNLFPGKDTKHIESQTGKIDEILSNQKTFMRQQSALDSAHHLLQSRVGDLEEWMEFLALTVPDHRYEPNEHNIFQYPR